GHGAGSSAMGCVGGLRAPVLSAHAIIAILNAASAAFCLWHRAVMERSPRFFILRKGVLVRKNSQRAAPSLPFMIEKIFPHHEILLVST
ncbi:hypothetical protein, partial [Klebsiella pneumoniae]|uniref:hypothetical protein n=1 Tax=Klebsiella pneumoniae TaxID=573 RepID=UPI002730E39A